jgi:phosphoenolpyruvate carboxykinase (GTP)
MRVLKWILDRSHGRVGAKETVVGFVPRSEDLNVAGLDLKEDALDEAMKVELVEWETELESQKEWLDGLGPTVPRSLELQRQLLLERVRIARARR